MKKSFESALALAEVLKDEQHGEALEAQLNDAIALCRDLYQALIIEQYKALRLEALVTSEPPAAEQILNSEPDAMNLALIAPVPEPELVIAEEPATPIIEALPEILPLQINLIDSIEDINRQSRSINQTKGAQVASLADRLHHKPIIDIKAAIPIHQKFLFIDTLFGKDKAAYERAIETLNKSVSFLEADDYLRNTLKIQYRWEMSHPITEELIDLVERRFL